MVGIIITLLKIIKIEKLQQIMLFYWLTIIFFDLNLMIKKAGGLLTKGNLNTLSLPF